MYSKVETSISLSCTVQCRLESISDIIFSMIRHVRLRTIVEGCFSREAKNYVLFCVILIDDMHHKLNQDAPTVLSRKV